MAVMAMVVPVPEGKLQALEDHIQEARARDDFESTLRGFGIEHESWHVQETPGGTLLILVFQCDDPPAMMQAFGASDAPLPTLQRAVLKETLGMDLTQPPPGPPPRIIFDWP